MLLSRHACFYFIFLMFFFFKQKTAYEMRISDWSSDVCSSDLLMGALRQCVGRLSEREQMVLQLYFFEELNLHEIGLTLDVSAARICQIKREAMIKVDRMMKEMTE